MNIALTLFEEKLSKLVAEHFGDKATTSIYISDADDSTVALFTNKDVYHTKVGTTNISIGNTKHLPF